MEQEKTKKDGIPFAYVVTRDGKYKVVGSPNDWQTAEVVAITVSAEIAESVADLLTRKPGAWK